MIQRSESDSKERRGATMDDLRPNVLGIRERVVGICQDFMQIADLVNRDGGCWRQRLQAR